MTKQVCFVFFIGYFGFIIYYCSLGPTYLIKLFKKNSQIAQIIFRILGEICILIAIAMGAIIDHKIILNIFTLVGISLIIFSVILACIGIYYLRMSSVYMAKEDKLITNGIYTKIRHPQALARILASFGLSMTLNSDLLMWLHILAHSGQ